MRNAFLTIVTMALSVTAATARAQQPMPADPAASQPQAMAPAQSPAPQTKPGYRTHDGFYLQLNSGIGYMGSSASAGGIDAKMSGLAGAFSVAVGGAVAKNFVVAGQLWDSLVLAPDVEVNGRSASNTDAALGLFGVGLNLTYYIMPANVYVSATPSVGVLSVAHGGTTYDTDSGFALRLAAGKEWWITGNWGIGVNLSYAYASNKEKDSSLTWKTNWFGAAFSATYN